MRTVRNYRLYDNHNRNLKFQTVIENVQRLANKKGVRYAVYFDKLLRNYSWIDTYENFMLKGKIPQSEIICEVDFDD